MPWKVSLAPGQTIGSGLEYGCGTEGIPSGARGVGTQREWLQNSPFGPDTRGFLKGMGFDIDDVGEDPVYEVPNELTRSMLEQRVRLPLLSAIADTADGDVASFAIVVNPAIDTEPIPVVDSDEEREDEAPAPAPRRGDTRLNQKYNFDNFVIGGSNRFAHAAAVARADGPAKAYNPLFIYGDSGLGKTHLLHAIGHYAENLYQGIQVR